ncbi:Nramp family divalent metal transporter [Winogradskyella aurantiaca]|uniref:Nramp family divalent metal transporter n=1 Tax=Winogradskyella aurantiaca TaxID=2219558 RepID=UPI000E1E0E3A|nr:Nramp family divalent metal transporter [Winogradskyella aurantiaca]
MISVLRRLGPGLLFAGAAIGVSHLVQSTRAGAEYGLGLVWALLIVNLFKYPFFEFGPRYAGATGESLLDGYRKLGKPYLLLYFILSLGTMFTIQTAVTIVTAGIADSLFGSINFLNLNSMGFSGVEIWTVIILLVCCVILVIGKYKALDRLIKILIILLALSTLTAVVVLNTKSNSTLELEFFWPVSQTDLVFLIAFMGWMPAPIDVSVFHSLWVEEQTENSNSFKIKEALFDFNIGYIATVGIGILFVILGALVLYNSGETFGAGAAEFASQLVGLYTSALGEWSAVIIGVAALSAMWSTTITTLDASPRAMAKSVQLLFGNSIFSSYYLWLIILTCGTIMVFLFLASEMALLVKVATVLSFITAPVYAILNFWLITSKYTPVEHRPGTYLKLLSWAGILFLIIFGIWFLVS